MTMLSEVLRCIIVVFFKKLNVFLMDSNCVNYFYMMFFLQNISIL